MDSARILTALEEREKWRERRARLDARLRQVQAHKRYLQRELEEVRRRIAHLLESLAAPHEEPVSWDLPASSFRNVR